MNALTPVVGVVAVVLSILFALPQAIRVHRPGPVSGVSAPTTLLVWCTGMTWATYGMLQADPAIVVANGTAVIAMSVTLAGLHRRGLAEWGTLLTIVVVWAVVFGLALGLAGDLGLGLVGAALGIAMTAPQGYRALRHGVEGVSITTYALLLSVAMSWLAYGVLIGDPIIIAPNIFSSVVVSGVLVILIRATRSNAVPAQAVRTG